MNCPFCSSPTEVYNSRKSHQNTQTWRRRRCKACQRAFTTREKIDFNGLVKVATHSGNITGYHREKLLLSVLVATEKLTLSPEILSELVDTIELKLKNDGFYSKSLQKSTQITETTTLVLRSYDTNLALQYLNKVYDNQPPMSLVAQLLR